MKASTPYKEEKLKKKEKKKKRLKDIRKVEKGLSREVMVKIRLERIDIQEEIIVEVLLDSRVT